MLGIQGFEWLEYTKRNDLSDLKDQKDNRTHSRSAIDTLRRAVVLLYILLVLWVPYSAEG
jgi:hypothetical protein